MRSTSIIITAVAWLAWSSELAASDPVNDQWAVFPLQSGAFEIHELHEVFLTVQYGSGEPDTIRHRDEEEKLLGRMSRNHGTWDSHHPRHRLLQALHGFSRYEERNMAELNRWRGLYRHVSKKQKEVLEREVQYSGRFSTVERLLKSNQGLCQAIVDNALQFYRISNQELEKFIRDTEKSGSVAEKVSVGQSLKHFVRDWAESGIKERDPGFTCVLNTLDDLFPTQENTNAIPKVMIPGAGLGRLGHEAAKLGFEVTINEWSMYMNIAYRFLESHRERHSQTFYPFVDSWSHHASTNDMIRPVSFPDVPINASSVVLVEGDFTTAFKDGTGTYDVVITYFFIDTARNLVSYFDTIHLLLRPGGYWLNFGPLLYGTAPFVQLSLDEIVSVVESFGFQFLETKDTCGDITLPGKQVRGKEAIYGFNDRALTKNAYNSQFWVAQKQHS